MNRRIRYTVEIVTASSHSFHKQFTEEFTALRCYARNALLIGPAVTNVRMWDHKDPMPVLMRDALTPTEAPDQDLVCQLREASAYLLNNGYELQFGDPLPKGAAA